MIWDLKKGLMQAAFILVEKNMKKKTCEEELAQAWVLISEETTLSQS